VLTGFSGLLTYFPPFLAGSSLRVANLLNPDRWGHLGPGWLTAADVYSEAYIYFADGPANYDRDVTVWSHEVGSEPFAVGELPSLLAMENQIDYGSVTAPVLVLQGQWDLSACGGQCEDLGLEESLRGKFSGAKEVVVMDDLPAG
jgi:hypothetical protein